MVLKIKLDKERKLALEEMENGTDHVFLTGRAGAGKSTLLDYFRKHTAKKMVVLAPTGIAAINVRGQTAHSFFGFRPGITVHEAAKYNLWKSGLCKQLDLIVIDEVSMVRADFMDCMDAFLRANGRDKNLPFGGIRMIFMGDLYQLPPVVTEEEEKWFKELYESPYFFSSKVFKSVAPKYIVLQKVYRQKEKELVRVLNAVRTGLATNDDLNVINTRWQPNPPADLSGYVYLATTNSLVEAINSENLSKMSGEGFAINGQIMGKFPIERLPTAMTLTLKEGCQVMLLNNDMLGRWVNGDIGTIVSIKPMCGTFSISVKIGDRGTFDVPRNNWDDIGFNYNKETKKVESFVRGTFFQFPLKLAWAVTIHKSQGKTFDKAVIDFGKGTFASGQTYVALSRCTTLDGLILRQPLSMHDIYVDDKIVTFMNEVEKNNIAAPKRARRR